MPQALRRGQGKPIEHIRGNLVITIDTLPGGICHRHASLGTLYTKKREWLGVATLSCRSSTCTILQMRILVFMIVNRFNKTEPTTTCLQLKPLEPLDRLSLRCAMSLVLVEKRVEQTQHLRDLPTKRETSETFSCFLRMWDERARSEKKMTTCAATVLPRINIWVWAWRTHLFIAGHD